MFIVSIYYGVYGDFKFYVDGEFKTYTQILRDSKLYDILRACDNHNYDLACSLIRKLYLVKTIIICYNGSIFIREY